MKKFIFLFSLVAFAFASCNTAVEPTEVNQDSILAADSAAIDSSVKAELLQMDTLHRTLDSTK